MSNFKSRLVRNIIIPRDGVAEAVFHVEGDKIFCNLFEYVIIPFEKYGMPIDALLSDNLAKELKDTNYDRVQEMIVKLSSVNQEKLYRWMYDALRCRR